MDSLRNSIVGLREKTCDARYFVPEKSLRKLMTLEIILQALPDSIIQKREVSQKILKSGRKIFSILILTDQTHHLLQFISSDLLQDARLPFKKKALTKEANLSEQDAKTFKEKQWEFDVPRFSCGTLPRTFKKSTILPFATEIFIGKGSCGHVYANTLVEGHQETGTIFPLKFARKEMPQKYEHAKELRNLTILHQLKHPNIVELLGAYTQRGKHSLLFPLCEDGNLASMLVNDSQIPLFAEASTLLIALAELSSAVEHVHDFVEEKLDLQLIGCHHDLRPHNILLSGSHFILTDFGLSTFKPLHEESDTPFKSVAGDYLAPECEDWDDGFEPADVHRSVDIWAFGCMLVEIATYVIYGHEAVRQFRVERCKKVRGMRLYMFHEGPNRPSLRVEQQLNMLESAEDYRTLITTARKILAMNQGHRPKAAEVATRLRFTAMEHMACAIKKLFARIRETEDTLDEVLEHRRFESWTYAVGIDGFMKGSIVDDRGIHHIRVHFQNIVGCLGRIRKDLNNILHPDFAGQTPDISNISHQIDQLHTHLTRSQQQSARTHFKLAILADEAVPTENGDCEYVGLSFHKEIQMRVVIKRMNDLYLANGTAPENSYLINADAIRLSINFGKHHLATLVEEEVERKVLVEWRHYLTGGTGQTIIKNLYGQVAQIVHKLSQDHPTEFRTLPCKGFYHDQNRGAFGIVFDLPRARNLEQSLEPMSLESVIAETCSKDRMWPDLDDRYRLASMLAKSLYELHEVHILHKNLTSANIAFFPRTGAPIGERLREPFLNGFSHSRPNEPKAFTEGMARKSNKDYQHPSYIKTGKGYRPEFDYFSLGIILIEIGCWKPYTEIIKGFNCSYEERPQKLFGDMQKRIYRITVNMGREYLEVVKFCIGGGLQVSVDGSHDEQASMDTSLRFHESVVQPLDRYFR